MAGEQIRTTIPEIVDYWAKHTGECGLSVDFAEAHERCWRCGCQRSLERCHIVPASLGGEDTPSNFVILCKRCHLDNPNVADPEVMWDWLRAYGVPFYDTFWWVNGIEEYKKDIREILCRGTPDAGNFPGGPGIQGGFGRAAAEGVLPFRRSPSEHCHTGGDHPNGAEGIRRGSRPGN